MTTYTGREVAAMANHVFHGLCKLDEEQRRNNEDPKWQNIGPLADQVRAITNKVHVACVAEYALLRKGFIELNIQNAQVRLRRLGRENCARGIDIPPSDIQKLRKQLGE
jgi:hypothetical protein